MGIGGWMVGVVAGGAVVAAIANAALTEEPARPSGGSTRTAPAAGAPRAGTHRHEAELRPAVRRHPEAVRPERRRRAAPRPRGVVRQLERERALVASALLYLLGADVPPLQR